MEKRHAEEIKSTSYELFIISLTGLQVFNLVLLQRPISDSARGVVLLFGEWMTMVFMLDFAYRLFTASSKVDYFFRRYGWADLIGSLPILISPYLRLFRLVRAVRSTRQLGGRAAVRNLRQQRAGSTLLGVLLMVVFVLEVGSISILEVEGSLPEANIHTPVQALWWGLVTMATVGYGDFYPVTNTGRLIGVFVITTGVAVLGVFSGSVANYFLRPRRGEPSSLIASEQDPAEGRSDAQPPPPVGNPAGATDSSALLDEIQHLRLELAERDLRLEARLAALEGRDKQWPGQVD